MLIQTLNLNPKTKTLKGENMNKWIVWIVTFVIFFGLHTNVKFKAIFKIDIVNFLIIHVVISFNGDHKKNWMNSKKIIDS
jgi:hypothetical protein